jgi:hypothetical protein
MNAIPREGGNRFNGVFFFNGTTEGLAGSNFTQRLKDAGLRTPNASINVIEPGTLYGERLNQLDFRVGKILRFGGRKATVNLDLYNALNVDTVQTLNNAFGPLWQRPSTVILARFAKIGMQLDF